MSTKPHHNEREVAVSAVVRASRLAQHVAAHRDAERTILKKDSSPVTIADFAVQVVIAHDLGEAFGDVQLVAEEDANAVRADATLRGRILEYARSTLPSLQDNELVELLDRGNYAGGSGRFWTLDPIDGTKGFLRGEQYAIALALIEDGQVRLGVLGCPNLPLSAKDATVGCVAIAVEANGAVVRGIDDSIERPIHASDIGDPAQAAFCESVEAAHSKHDDAARIATQLGVAAPPVRMDSQAKYVTVARGDAEIYLRLPTRADYEEKIWDHAAGAVIVREAGGQVSDVLGRPLDFARGKTLRGNYGAIASNRKLYERVVMATRPVFEHLPPR